MSAVVGTATLTQLGQKTQIKVTAHYSDGSAKYVTARELGTTYRFGGPWLQWAKHLGAIRASFRSRRNLAPRRRWKYTFARPKH